MSPLVLAMVQSPLILAMMNDEPIFEWQLSLTALKGLATLF